MRIFALETTDRRGSLAAMDGDQILAELVLEPDKRSARTLAPGIRRLLADVGWKATDIELVGVSIGPGSFTGLRIGLVTAKTLAYAAGANVLGIDTLEVIAAAANPDVDTVWAAVDAQRGQAVVRPFRRSRESQDALEPAGPADLVDLKSWLASLPQGSLVSGPILERLADPPPPGIYFAPRERWSPTASQVARLAWRHHQAGRRDDLWDLAPRYSRPSAAEEKRDRQNNRS